MPVNDSMRCPIEDLTDRFFLDGWARRLGSWPAIKTAPTAILQSTGRELHGEVLRSPLISSSVGIAMWLKIKCVEKSK